MFKNLTCIECPKGCRLSIEIENGKVLKVAENQCAKGDKYGRAEIENPMRMLTSAVLSQGLSLRMIPVRTDKPIPKSKIFEAMEKVRKIKVSKAVKAGEVIEKDFVEKGTNLISTRSSH